MEPGLLGPFCHKRIFEAFEQVDLEPIYRQAYQIEHCANRTVARLRKTTRLKTAFYRLIDRIELERRIARDLAGEGVLESLSSRIALRWRKVDNLDKSIEVDELPSLFGATEHREGNSQLKAGAGVSWVSFERCSAKRDYDLRPAIIA
jgi:hypothetical protein